MPVGRQGSWKIMNLTAVSSRTSAVSFLGRYSALGGPCFMRRRRSSGSLGGVQGDSIHHCLREGTHDGGRPPRVFTGRLALPYDVEGAVLFSVLPDVVLDLGDGLGRNARYFGTPADRGRKQPVVA